MNASVLPRLRLLGAVSILAFAVTAAMAQSGPEAGPAAPAAAKGTESPAAAGKAEAQKKGSGKTGEKAGTRAKPARPSGYATEAEARAHCRGSVVWVDQDHFNHYPGSREYGRKPGAFQCEKG